jgi:hypothetical protein
MPWVMEYGNTFYQISNGNPSQKFIFFGAGKPNSNVADSLRGKTRDGPAVGGTITRAQHFLPVWGCSIQASSFTA